MSKKPREVEPLTVNVILENFRVSSFHYVEPEIIDSPLTTVNFGFTMKQFLNEDYTRLLMRPTLAIRREEELDGSPLFEMTCVFTFKIDQPERFVKGDEIDFPKVFLAHLTGIAVSTMRGLLPAKLANTVFINLVMPLIDSSPLISKEPFKVLQVPKKIY